MCKIWPQESLKFGWYIELMALQMLMEAVALGI
jgi:hypothetical protein